MIEKVKSPQLPFTLAEGECSISSTAAIPASSAT